MFYVSLIQWDKKYSAKRLKLQIYKTVYKIVISYGAENWAEGELQAGETKHKLELNLE